MIIVFLLATTLNMSLPEFQPQEDISGNVIVSSIDDETKEIVAEEIPFEDISISDNESDRVLQGLSLEHDRTEEFEEVPLLRSDGETNYLNVSVSQSGGDNPGGYVSGGDISGDEPGGDVSGDEPGGNISADLTNVENKLDNIILLQRSILLVLLVSFLFPIIKSSVNLLKGGKDV